MNKKIKELFDTYLFQSDSFMEMLEMLKHINERLDALDLQVENTNSLYKDLRSDFDSRITNFDSENRKELHIISEKIETINRDLLVENNNTKTVINKLEKTVIEKLNEFESTLMEKVDEVEKTLVDKNGEIEQALIISSNSFESKLRESREISLRHINTTMYELLDPQLYEQALRQWYLNNTGKVLDLNNVKTFNEKIQWMKMYGIDEVKTHLTDKYQVREWIKEKIGEEYLVPLIAVYYTPEQIEYNKLPNQFVIKCTHGSAMNIVVRDKSTLNINNANARLKRWLKENFAFHNGFEMQYYNIPRRIIIEEYCEGEENDLPDYKFWCFDGKVRFIQKISGRGNNPHMGLFDLEWNLLPFSTGAYPLFETKQEKPSKLEEMIKVAEILSKDFSHVRVDLYQLKNGDIKFGEMTFTTSSGVVSWSPVEADSIVGEWFNLPEHK